MKHNIFYNNNNKLKQIERQRNDNILLNNILKAKSKINNNLDNLNKVKVNKFKNKYKKDNIVKENKILIRKLSKINERKNNNYKITNKTVNKFDLNNKKKFDEINKENIKILKKINLQKPTINIGNKKKIKKKIFNRRSNSNPIKNKLEENNNDNVIENEFNLNENIVIDNNIYKFESNLIKDDVENLVYIYIESNIFNYTKKYTIEEWTDIFINQNNKNLKNFIIDIKKDIEEVSSKEDEELIEQFKMQKKIDTEYNDNKNELNKFISVLENKRNDNQSNFSSDFEN